MAKNQSNDNEKQNDGGNVTVIPIIEYHRCQGKVVETTIVSLYSLKTGKKGVHESYKITVTVKDDLDAILLWVKTIINKKVELISPVTNKQDDNVDSKNCMEMTMGSRVAPLTLEDYFQSENGTQGNPSYEVGRVVWGQIPSFSDMERENMSPTSTHAYSRDHSPPSWDTLCNRASSPMMTESESDTLESVLAVFCESTSDILESLLAVFCESDILESVWAVEVVVISPSG